jgi:hypothetical protein
MCAAPSKGCYTDITGASRDLCDDCVPPEDCMSVPDWVKLTYEEQQELCNKVLDCADSLCDGINKKEVCVALSFVHCAGQHLPHRRRTDASLRLTLPPIAQPRSAAFVCAVLGCLVYRLLANV